MALTSITSYATTITGSDVNGNTVNQTIQAPPVINTGIVGVWSVFLDLVTGANTINANVGTGGWKTCTVCPPANSAVSIALGGSSGLAVAPNQPFSFGLPSGTTSFVLYAGTTSGTPILVTFG